MLYSDCLPLHMCLSMLPSSNCACAGLAAGVGLDKEEEAANLDDVNFDQAISWGSVHENPPLPFQAAGTALSCRPEPVCISSFCVVANLRAARPLMTTACRGRQQPRLTQSSSLQHAAISVPTITCALPCPAHTCTLTLTHTYLLTAAQCRLLSST